MTHTTYKLSEIASVQTGPFGSQLHQEDYVERGTPIVTVEHLGENRIIHENLPHVSGLDRERLAKYSLQTNDIVFSRVGSVDRRALVREKENGWLFSGRCLRVRANSENVDPTFLSFYFGQESFKEYIRGIAVGATMPSINTQILSQMQITLPSIETQKRVSKILSSLDDKIELNRLTNATLEKVVQALFKAWFVDFEPVNANMENRLSESAPPEIAKLFPFEFENEIPKGWQKGELGEILELAYGKALKEENRIFGDVPVYGSNGQIGWHNQFLTEAPGIVVGRKGNPGTVIWVDENFFPIDTTFYVKSIYDQKFLFYTLQNLDLPNLSADSAVPGLNRNTAYREKIILPAPLLIEKFSESVLSIYRKITSNNKENKWLTEIRDLLLPRLISGKVRVIEITGKEIRKADEST